MPDILPQLKRTCDQCQSIIQVCGDHKVNFICIYNTILYRYYIYKTII